MQVKPGEPLYAQVNREKKKSNRGVGVGGSADGWAYEENAAAAAVAKGLVVDPASTPGGDSWV